jgi:hypothetical protein
MIARSARDLRMDLIEAIEKQVDATEDGDRTTSFILENFTVDQLTMVRRFIQSFPVRDPDE